MAKEEKIYAGVCLTLDELTDDELVKFYLSLQWPDQRTVCQDKPWFEALFT